jgi:HTH-type transcriptional regulator, quorum sensing regulator NprR
MTNDEGEGPQTSFGEAQKKPTPARKGRVSPLPQGAPHLANRLRTARLATGLTQQQLAGTRFSKGYISAIERGRMIPSLEALALLAARLSVTRAYLLGEGEADLASLKHERQLSGLLPDAPSPKDKAASEYLLARAVALLSDGDWDEALQVLGQGDAPPGSLFRLDLLAWHWMTGWALCQAQRPNEALPLLQEGLQLAKRLRIQLPHSQQARLAEEVVRLHHFLGVIFCMLGKTALAYGYHTQCREAILAGTVRDHGLKLLIYNGLGRDALVLGHFDESIAAYREAVRLAEHQDNPRQRGQALWGLGLAYQKYGNLQGAKASYLAAIAALEERNNFRLVAKVRNLLGHVLVHLGEIKAAERQFRLSLDVVRPLQDTLTWGYILGNLVELYLMQSKWEDAIEAAHVALRVVGQSRDIRNEGQLHLHLSAVYEAQQDQAATEQAFKKALALFEAIANHDLLVETRARYANFLKDQGRFQEAYEQIRL